MGGVSINKCLDIRESYFYNIMDLNVCDTAQASFYVSHSRCISFSKLHTFFPFNFGRGKVNLHNCIAVGLVLKEKKMFFCIATTHYRAGTHYKFT